MNYRKGFKYFLAILLIFAFSSSSTAGKIYRWMDENGVIGFTDDLSSLPEKYLKTATPYDEAGPGERPTILEGMKPSQPSEELETPADVDNNGHDEAWWKNRIQELKTQRDVLLQEKERLQEEYNTRYATWLNPFAPGNKNIGEINKQINSGKPVDPKLFFGLPVPQPEIGNNLEELKKQIVQADEELKDIEYDLSVGLPEEARKANAPPGWLRD
ncbi:MAG TPA: DUF4124 domain-containing protein [Nitrospiria bacterium]|jgi:hypothetical protein|nr:DUF4124 domain-containing protein [Nitrospiria bacterium]